MAWTATDTALQFNGLAEVPGHQSNPAILAMLKMDMDWPQGDSTPWCSAFANFVAHCLGLERTRSLRARSWLFIGTKTTRPVRGDVVIFSRGRWAPGPEVLKAKGHVAFYIDEDATHVRVVGGNQGDKVSIKRYPKTQVLGYRKLSRV